ncbi:MAG: metallophosphoesterase [Clostridia bacterium]|nr:metallophosphoesterase [Clostridia bacterium]
MPHKILIMSDVHLCHGDWYDVSSEDRMELMVNALNKTYREDPYDAIFFLGDYSLDHWVYSVGGSWLHQGLSKTKRLVDDYLSRLECPTRYLIPGNHEQYGHKLWKDITGCERQYAVVHDDWLFLMLDNFGANLDPAEDSDGTYTPADVDFIKEQMALHPDLPVVLCAHFFDLRSETEAFMNLVRDEERIVCLFCGHDHINRIECHQALGCKPIIHDGQFSYTIGAMVQTCPWGWTEVTLRDEGLMCSYVYPESKLTPAGRGPLIQVSKDPSVRFFSRK